MPLLPSAAGRPHRPRILLVPPPELPVPAVQGGAVETLLTHLIEENAGTAKFNRQIRH